MNHREWLETNYPHMLVGEAEPVDCAVCGEETRTDPGFIRQFYTCSGDCNAVLQEQYDSGMRTRWASGAGRRYHPSNELFAARAYARRGQKKAEQGKPAVARSWDELAGFCMNKIRVDGRVNFSRSQWKGVRDEAAGLERALAALGTDRP